MVQAVVIVLQLTLVAGVVGAVVYAVKRARKKWTDALAHDADVEPVMGSWTAGLSLRTRRPPHIRCTVRGGGKNNPPVWSLEGDGVRLAARTTLDISEEGFFGSMREKVGWQDVHIGDAGFDARYTIRGSDADAIRGVLSVPAVRTALRTAFDGGLSVVRISDNGRVVASGPRGGREPHDAKARALALQALVVVLDDNAQAPSRVEVVPAPSAGAQLGTASGTASGAPVPVPLKIDT